MLGKLGRSEFTPTALFKLSAQMDLYAVEYCCKLSLQMSKYSWITIISVLPRHKPWV